ncbi:kinase-like domain-containing protein [Pavlovales sp. CCMP2436]|nr:kinase-like domain-containing protein [Pavlovales sp. CCMP2436]
MIFEFMDHDLTGLMDSSTPRFTSAQIKCYMKQLLEGMHYVHANNVLHRDIKGANLLLNNRGELKLGDFGLARRFDRDKVEHFTNRCITLWYRPPELLLGTTRYTTAVDMWSIGCVFAEILLRAPLLPGRDEPDQFNRICNMCGTPVEENWAGVSKLPHFDKMVTQTRRPPCARKLRQEVGGRLPDQQAMDLLDKLLTLDPKDRIDAATALDHDYFWTDPMPAQPGQLPVYKSSHELARKKKEMEGAAGGAAAGPTRPPPAAGGTFARPRLPQPQAGGGFTGGVPKRPFGVGPAPTAPTAAGAQGNSQAQVAQKLPRYE